MDTTMDTAADGKWQRWGYLGGVVFVVLNVVGMFAPGAPPDIDASADKIAKYFVDNADGLKLGAILFGFAIVFGLWWLASIWRTIAGLEPNGPRLALIVVTGMVLSGAIAAVSQAVFSAIAIRPDTLAGGSEFVFTLGYSLFGLAAAGIAIHLLAAAVLTMRSKFLPAWTGWIALVGAIANAVGIIAAGSQSMAVAGFAVVGFLLWMLWILIVSLLLFMGKKG